MLQMFVQEHRTVERRGRRRRFSVDVITSNQQVLQNRTGVRTRLVSAEMREELGDRVVSMNILPFIRNRSISFSATRMKPNTRVYPFFDNVDISTYMLRQVVVKVVIL